MKKMKIIIYGYTDFSREFSRTFNFEDYELLIIEPDDKLYNRALNEQKQVLQLSLLSDDELKQIDITSPNIKSFIIASNDKNNNLFVTLSARNLNKKLSIICLSEYLHEDKQLMLAGASVVINPSSICGLRLARVISKPKIIDILDEILFGKSEINLYEYHISKNSSLDGKMLHDVGYDKFNLLVLGLQDRELGEKFIFGNLGIEHKLDGGDVLVLVGRDSDFENFKLAFE